MKVLICTPVHNALSQRAFHELVERGHAVEVNTATTNTDVEIAIACHQPQLLITLFHKNPLPEHIKKRIPVLSVRTNHHTDRGACTLNGHAEEDWQSLRIELCTLRKGIFTQNVSTEGASTQGIYTQEIIVESRMISQEKIKAGSNHSCHRHHAAQAAVHEILSAIESLENQHHLPEWLSEALYPDNRMLRGRLHQILN